VPAAGVVTAVTDGGAVSTRRLLKVNVENCVEAAFFAASASVPPVTARLLPFSSMPLLSTSPSASVRE